MAHLFIMSFRLSSTIGWWRRRTRSKRSKAEDHQPPIPSQAVKVKTPGSTKFYKRAALSSSTAATIPVAATMPSNDRDYLLEEGIAFTGYRQVSDTIPKYRQDTVDE